MNAVLIKILATALTFSQVATQPDAIKTHFDPLVEKQEVAHSLRTGCAHMRRAFDIEDVNVDDLIALAMDDPKAMKQSIAALGGLDFETLHVAYRAFCRGEPLDSTAIDLAQVIEFYNRALIDLPDVDRIRAISLPEMSVVLDRHGNRFAELFKQENRRIRVPLSDVPGHVINAFVAAEDRRFYEHRGIDERGLIRAMLGNLVPSKHPQGGSTITQQVAKGLLVGNDVTYERKMREMVIASRMECALSKSEILDLYLNAIYFGRGAWGVELAAWSYFNKSVRNVTLAEGAVLAALAKGPSAFDPDRHPERLRERVGYVLGRMQEDSMIDAEAMRQAQKESVQFAPRQVIRQDFGFHFLDQVAREVKGRAGIDLLTSTSLEVRSTIDGALQRATETALQEGLARYEIKAGRAEFLGAEINLANAIKKIGSTSRDDLPGWQQALQRARLPLYDVHWQPAVVLESKPKKGNVSVQVGLRDGQVLPLRTSPSAMRGLKPSDVVYVQLNEAKGRSSTYAEMRIRPQVQGAALVLENKTGQILAMTGSFSYPLSQLNRTSQTQRQPGSAIKPIVYLAALKSGLQPNTLLSDMPFALPPIGNSSSVRERDYWRPKNFDGGGSGVLTLRRALENSRNLATASLLDGGIGLDPETSLDRVCEIAMEARLYKDCVRYYPFILGAQTLRLVDLAAFYAAIANEGALPTPHLVASITRDGAKIFAQKPQLTRIGSGDPAVMFQLKTLLQGVVARGTAASMRHLSAYVAGKTGTSDNENDAWFVGFTNDVTIAVWVGYDNADGKRRTLGRGQTGGKVALPIFAAIVDAVWSNGFPRVSLTPPSPEAKSRLVALPIELRSGELVGDRHPGKFIEYFRTDAEGRTFEGGYEILAPSDAARLPSWGRPNQGTSPPWPHLSEDWRIEDIPMRQSPPLDFAHPRLLPEDEIEQRLPRRIDPDYFWDRRRTH